MLQNRTRELCKTNQCKFKGSLGGMYPNSKNCPTGSVDQSSSFICKGLEGSLKFEKTSIPKFVFFWTTKRIQNSGALPGLSLISYQYILPRFEKKWFFGKSLKNVTTRNIWDSLKILHLIMNYKKSENYKVKFFTS